MQADRHRNAYLDSLTPERRTRLAYEWGFYAREKQRAPEGDWRYWLNLAGRGFGKTRTGTEFVRLIVENKLSRGLGIALVGATEGDARDIIVEGESGILRKFPPWLQPKWNKSDRLLTWDNGEWARTYSGNRPERLRGKQHAYAWADELASWQYPESWDQLLFGLRLGNDPRCIITTTPRPTPLIRELFKDPATVVTSGSSYENRANLARAFLETIVKKYEGTRLGRQELYAHILDDNPAALWKRSTIDALRRTGLVRAEIKARMRRIVVAIDPAVTSSESSAETGIIVAGVDDVGHVWILEDKSGKYSPAQWARLALFLYKEWDADRIVAEVNNGGDLVETTLRAIDANVAYTSVHASRGKLTRAEPVAALYEQGKAHHAGIIGAPGVGGVFTELEDQLCNWDPISTPKSPDRLDAMVWAVSFLVFGEAAPKRGALADDVARKLW